MNIAVYVTSNYSNYDEFSKLLSKYLGKYTTSPVLLTASSRSTKDGHGNKMVKRYADENKLKCKVYETEWNKWRKSAGSIASYHISHNSERSIVFWDGMSRGCKNLLQMVVRLNRPCDLVRINPSAVNLPPEAKAQEPTAAPTTAPTSVPQPTVAPSNGPSAPSDGPSGSDTAAPTPTATADGGTNTPQAGETPTATANQNGAQPTDAISKEFVKSAETVPQNQPSNTTQQTATSQNGVVAQPQPTQQNTQQTAQQPTVQQAPSQPQQKSEAPQTDSKEEEEPK